MKRFRKYTLIVGLIVSFLPILNPAPNARAQTVCEDLKTCYPDAEFYILAAIPVQVVCDKKNCPTVVFEYALCWSRIREEANLAADYFQKEYPSAHVVTDESAQALNSRDRLGFVEIPLNECKLP